MLVVLADQNAEGLESHAPSLAENGRSDENLNRGVGRGGDLDRGGGRGGDLDLGDERDLDQRGDSVENRVIMDAGCSSLT